MPQHSAVPSDHLRYSHIPSVPLSTIEALFLNSDVAISHGVRFYLTGYDTQKAKYPFDTRLMSVTLPLGFI